MLIQPVRQRRSATTIVECALVFPALMIFLFGLIIGGLGVFRYQEVASLAREGARYASVRGTDYSSATGKPAATDLRPTSLAKAAAASSMLREPITATPARSSKWKSPAPYRTVGAWCFADHMCPASVT